MKSPMDDSLHFSENPPFLILLIPISDANDTPRYLTMIKQSLAFFSPFTLRSLSQILKALKSPNPGAKVPNRTPANDLIRFVPDANL